MRKKKKELSLRNPLHAELISGKYRKRIEPKKVGKASYQRRQKHRPDYRDGVSVFGINML